MEFLSEYGLFLLKIITITVALLVLFGGLLGMSRKGKMTQPAITPLHEDYLHLKKHLTKVVKGEKLKIKKSKVKKPNLYVIEFQGDVKATQVEQLREEVTAVLSIIQPQDEVVVKIESPGGAVNGYGLAASQLQRIRDAKVPLTACIDKVAASGGYLMACVANQIVAAPFAILGSIGVVSQFPNFHRWLQKHNIDVELLTAGEYKRTLTMFAENTEKGRQKFKEDLEKIHLAFRDYVLKNREQLNIEEVATGEFWLASDALPLKLVDELKTSDDYLINKMQDYNVFKLAYEQRPSLLQKLLKPAAQLLHPWA